MRFHTREGILLASIIMLSIEVAGNDSRDPATGEEVDWQVISGGGENNGGSTNFGLADTVGQVATGAGSSSDFGLRHGFW
jgi:hypothetical protein